MTPTGSADDTDGTDGTGSAGGTGLAAAAGPLVAVAQVRTPEPTGGERDARPPGRFRSLVDLYLRTMRIAVTVQLQYRVANYLFMVGMVAEPVIYLVVWSAVADANGGSVGGYTAGTFAAYYVVWTLVRNMNIVFTPYGWEQRIRQGRLSGQLLQPVHPIHYDLAYFAGWKFVVVVLWLPVAAVLGLVFRPALHPDAAQVAAFVVAIWGAYLLRSVCLWLLGMVTFWTTRVAALFQLYFALELLLSGRLVPLRLMPGWVRQAADLLPFQYAFGFPIQALVGPVTTGQLLVGLATQAAWIAAGAGLVAVVWRRAVRRYSAVGN